MGFKDFFAKGPSGRNDNHQYNHGIPTQSMMGGSSATNQRYSQNMSSTGLHPTDYYRHSQQQQPRSMSLSSRSFRPQEQQQQQGRTMSMSMRTNSFSNQQRYSLQPGSRTLSMNSNSARPGVNSRTNSLTAASRGVYGRQQHPQQQQLSRTNSRTNSRNNSRANSLTSGMAHTKIIKTTKETDMDGRTRSITTTTIEKRGDMKIVRTTVIQPSNAIDEDVELEELAELEDEFDNFDSEAQGYDDEFDEFEHSPNNGNMIGNRSTYDNTATLAANAAAAALGLNATAPSPVLHESPKPRVNQKLYSPRQQQYSPKQQSQPQYISKRSQISPLASPVQRKNEVRFHDDHTYPNNEYETMEEPLEPVSTPAVVDYDEEILVETLESTPSDSFRDKAQNRLSQIQEVTELYDSSRENVIVDPSTQVAEEKAVTTKDTLSSPFSGFNSYQPPQMAGLATNSTLNSEDEQFEEAQEVILPDPPAITDINAPKPNAHSYRNLTTAPVANSNGLNIPTPPSTAATITDSTRPFTDTESFVSSQQHRKLKSALKNSNSSLNSSSNGEYQQRATQQVFIRAEKPSPRLPQMPVSRVPEHTPDEMYLMALKAAEKKVYGDRMTQVYVQPPVANDIDDGTMANTIQNVNPASAGYQTSQPGIPYQSNANGVGFKLHSLRDVKEVKASRKSENHDTSHKKLLKKEQKAQKKQWEQERRAIADSANPLTERVSENVNRRVSRMPVNPDVENNLINQQQRVQMPVQSDVVSNQESVSSKSKFNIFKLGKKKGNSSSTNQHRKNPSLISQDSNISTSSGSKRRFFMFGNKHVDPHNENPVMQVKNAQPFTESNIPIEAKVTQETIAVVGQQPVIASGGDMHTIPENEVIQHEIVTHIDIPVEVPLADTAVTTTDSSNEEPVLPAHQLESPIISNNDVYADAITGFEPTIINENDTLVEPVENIHTKYEQHVAPMQIPGTKVEQHVESNKKANNGKSGRKLLRFFNL